MKLLFISVLMVWGIVSCNQSEWYQASERERAASEAARWAHDSVPHVIREADGCKVYAFKTHPDARWAYFTRCSGGQTVTESSWEECHREGKRQVCEVKTNSMEAR